MIIGYARVSTKTQLEGNGLQAQVNEILEKYEGAKIEMEQFTGTKTDRPVLNKLIDSLKKGDTLVVTKLDRLARNTVEGIQIIESLFAKGVAVHVLNVGLLENTTMGRFFLTTLLAVAEMERNIIIERTQAGKEVAKQNPDFKEGRPNKYGNKQIELALELLETKTYKQVEELTGISKSTLIRAKKKAMATNVATPATTEQVKVSSKHKALLKAFKEVNPVGKDIVEVIELVNEPQAKYDGVAIKVILNNNSWLRVYRGKNGEINWY